LLVPLSLSPEQRSLRASTAAFKRWSKEDPKPALAKVREGWWRRFEDEVDPDRKLPEQERHRRAEAAMKGHMARMALASSRARSKRAET
jgi:hypothetical protein